MFTDLDPSLKLALTEAGYEKPTDVQTATFEAALDGQDLFVSAKTGSGKTAAFLIPTFEQLLFAEPGHIQALVLVPTRELAQQVLKHAKQIARYTPIKLGHIGGGTDIHKQNDLIANPPQFLVATPGRLSELLAKDLIDLSGVKILVLDEADRMLDMGFSDEVLAISEHCTARSQTQFYSATLANKGLRGLASLLLFEPEIIELNQTKDAHEGIVQQVVYADDFDHKVQLSRWLIEQESDGPCIVFCNTKETADKLYAALQQTDLAVGILHGDRDQKQRNLMMSKMRRAQLKALVATDIAARGLDIESLGLVINFDMPRRAELYVHRIGRTGRAGKLGTAVSLISAPEYNLLSSIERYLKQHFSRRKIKALEGNYKGPKKVKSSGKAAGKKKKKRKK